MYSLGSNGMETCVRLSFVIHVNSYAVFCFIFFHCQIWCVGLCNKGLQMNPIGHIFISLPGRLLKYTLQGLRKNKLRKKESKLLVKDRFHYFSGQRSMQISNCATVIYYKYYYHCIIHFLNP